MIRLIFALLFGLPFLCAQAQDNAQLDSLLAEPQTLELKLSTPQPRLNETFQLSLDINYVRAHIFKSIVGKFRLADGVPSSADRENMVVDVVAEHKGKNEIGPLSFNLNGTKYTTNRVKYEVIEALPNVDEGVWFRIAFTNDSTFCLITEQRIPAENKTRVLSDTSMSFYTEARSDEPLKYIYTSHLNGLRGGNSTANSTYGYIYNNQGDRKEFLFSYSINYFTIIDKKAKIKFTRNEFSNIPHNYKFKDIEVQ